MSWLVDIAGKAEDFLNKIDKNAAVALNTGPNGEKLPRPKKSEPFIEPSGSESGRGRDRDVGVSVSNVDTSSAALLGTQVSNEGITTSYVGASTSRKTNKKQQSRTSKSSNSSELSSVSSSKVKESVSLANKTPVIQNGVDSKKSTSVISSNSAVNDKPNEDELIAFLNSNDDSGGMNESLILKGEVETQARELKLLTKNHRSLQKDYEELKLKLDACREKLASAESAKYSNEAEERDLRKLVEERDAEIHSLSSRHQQALEALQKLELSQENLQKLEQCLLENAHMKSENESLQQRTEMLSSQVETTENHLISMKSTLSSMEKEFTNYKEKAKSILNYKDELIASLKGDNGAVVNGDVHSNSSEELIAEITALKNERELLQADISQTRALVASLKDDNRRLEKEVSTLRCFTEDLGSQLKMEKDSGAMLQSENLQVCQQLTSLQFEMEREKNERRKYEDLAANYKQASSSRNSSNHSFDRMSINNGHVGRNNNGSIIDEMEVSKLKTRVSALSQSLYEKQSLINDISTDKQLLQIEVERLKNDLRESRAESNEFCHGGGLPQTVIASQPLYLSESPWDSRVSARMKRIYTQLDAVFCQFGLALRKRPNLRLGMSLYVVFLHLWVFFVLFSWMHHSPPDGMAMMTIVVPSYCCMMAISV